MNIYIICSVRNASKETRDKLEAYTLFLEKQGHTVHLPHRDTNQTGKGIEICTENCNATLVADEIHVFYDKNSTGSHFDLGMAFALNKKIVIIENGELTEGKSFPRMLTEWVKYYE